MEKTYPIFDPDSFEVIEEEDEEEYPVFNPDTFEVSGGQSRSPTPEPEDSASSLIFDPDTFEITEQQPQQRTTQKAPVDKYTTDDLYLFEDEIRRYGKVMVGDEWDNLPFEEVSEQYKNRMRGFSAGNSVRAGRELVRLSQLDDKQLAEVGGGYKV